MQPLTRKELNSVPCPNGSQLMLSAPCHPGSPLRALYDRDDGCLHLSCICSRPLSVICVAATLADVSLEHLTPEGSA